MPDFDVSAVGFRLKRPAFAAAATSGSGRRERRQLLDQAFKRGFDICIALAAIVALAPLFVLVASAIWAMDGGTPFYSHRRIGRGRQVFGCLKFRTMRVDGQEILAQHLIDNPDALAEWTQTRKLRDDPRITAIGHLLRRSSIDELPQLFNILRGEMSIVGPRPVVADEIEKYGDAFAAYLSVRPGLTGMWQVSGRSDTSYAERVRLDQQYAESRSFLGDMVIILRTIPAVFLLKGSC